MRVCLFEDGGVSNLEPLTLTRPAFDLLCGQTPLASKQCRHFAPCEIGALIRPSSRRPLSASAAGHCHQRFALAARESAILVNGRWLPPANASPDFAGPCVAMVGEEVAYAVVGPNLLTYCSSNTLEDCLETWKNTLPHHQAGGQMINYPWDLVQCKPTRLAADFAHIVRRQLFGEQRRGRRWAC